MMITCWCGIVIAQDNTVSLSNVKDYVGKQVTVCDSVTQVYNKADDKPTMIRFGGVYPKYKFTAVIFAKDRSKFKFDMIKELTGHKVCVIGKISMYKEEIQMILNKEVQIRVED